MILSDREIQAALARGSITITPKPSQKAYSSMAIDLTLDSELRAWRTPLPGVESKFCPGVKDFSVAELANRHADRMEIPAYGGFDPGSFVLGWTVEKIQLPHRSRIAARVEGKSSLARLGIGVHVTAPTIHAGFGFDAERPDEGLPIQLEMFNLGPLTIQLVRGLPICQLIFEEVHGTPDKGYEGRFSRQGPQSPRPPKG
jgi:dCTP deaminase